MEKRMMEHHRSAGVLSHVEAMYRPGERELAIALFEALGCKTYDTGTPSPSGSNYVSVHPDPDDRSLDNVIYLSEMPAEQSRLEALLRQSIAGDDELRRACESYRAMAHDKPFGLSHIAIRYPSFDSLEAVLAGIEARLTPALRSRLVLTIFRPGDAEEIAWSSIQAFVHTDIAVAGISAFGQTFELSAYGDWS